MGQLLARIYRKFFWRAYDNIGRLLAVNLLWFAIFPVLTYLSFRLVPLDGAAAVAATLLVGLLTASYAGAGVFALTARITRREKSVCGNGDTAMHTLRPGLLRAFFCQAWRYFPRMTLLYLVFGGAVALLFHSIRFYSNFKVGGGILGFFLAGIQIWILAFILLMVVYALPLLYLKDWGIRRILKWSAFLVILRPGLTVLIFIQAFAMFGLLTFTGVGFVLLAYGHTALFLNVAVLEVLKEMEDKWIAKKKPTSWKEIMAERDAEAEADEKRTLRDILRPWE